MEKEIIDAGKPRPKPLAQKLFKRGRSFRDIQSEISKINPEVLKAVITSGSSASITAEPPMTISSFSAPSTPREHHSFLPPLLPLYTSTYRPTPTTTTCGCDSSDSTSSLTIFYNGTVAVFEVPRCKAGYILKLAGEEESLTNVKFIEEDESFKHVQSRLAMKFGITPNEFDRNLNENLPLAPNISLKRFLEKRKERLIMGSPYANGNLKGAGVVVPSQMQNASGPVGR